MKTFPITKIPYKWILVGIPLIFLLAVSYGIMSRITTAIRSVMHSHAVIESLEAMFTHMQDAETGQRGYLLTGEIRYLEPFNRTFTTLDKDIPPLLPLFT